MFLRIKKVKLISYCHPKYIRTVGGVKTLRPISHTKSSLGTSFGNTAAKYVLKQAGKQSYINFYLNDLINRGVDAGDVTCTDVSVGAMLDD